MDNVEINNLLQKIDNLLSTKQLLTSNAEIKNFCYEVKNIIFSNQILNEQYEKKVNDYKKCINSDKFKQMCEKLLHIIEDASFELYIKNPPQKWYSAKMYSPLLNKNEFINEFVNTQNIIASLFNFSYFFYERLLLNQLDTKNALFENRGQSEFIKLSIESLMIIAGYKNENFDLAIKEFINCVGTSIDFYNLDIIDIFTFDELYKGPISLFNKISCISVLNELKIDILKEKETHSRKHYILTKNNEYILDKYSFVGEKIEINGHKLQEYKPPRGKNKGLFSHRNENKKPVELQYQLFLLCKYLMQNNSRTIEVESIAENTPIEIKNISTKIGALKKQIDIDFIKRCNKKSEENISTTYEILF